MTLQEFIRRMPKVELHVHLEGAIRPDTLLALALRNNVALPATTIEGIKEWYHFSDFAHFAEIYRALCACLRTPDDFELITTEFLKHQAEQNILYSEVIFTPYTHRKNVAFDDQLAAINRARAHAESVYGVRMGLVPDIAREDRPIEDGFLVAQWAVNNMKNGIIGLGLGGPEIGNPPELFHDIFERARAQGLPGLPHAGETVGPGSMWGAINSLSAVRIGHGVRCLEDPELVDFLRGAQLPLDVSPTSNICLGVARSLSEHPLPKLVDAGLLVTINSDDPPMFDTTLTDEYLSIAATFGFGREVLKKFVFNGIHASLLPADDAQALEVKCREQFVRLEEEGEA
jgi:aminodeoxyfutalosine deaminase